MQLHDITFKLWGSTPMIGWEVVDALFLALSLDGLFLICSYAAGNAPIRCRPEEEELFTRDCKNRASIPQENFNDEAT
jgi:hypothetical protein